MYSATILYCMRVHNAVMFGGKGSVGYAHRKFMEIYPLVQSHDDFEALGIKIVDETAQYLGVNVSDIQLISESEYFKETKGANIIEEQDFYANEEDPFK